VRNRIPIYKHGSFDQITGKKHTLVQWGDHAVVNVEMATQWIKGG
jgi:hypothetical protein